MDTKKLIKNLSEGFKDALLGAGVSTHTKQKPKKIDPNKTVRIAKKDAIDVKGLAPTTSPRSHYKATKGSKGLHTHDAHTLQQAYSHAHSIGDEEHKMGLTLHMLKKGVKAQDIKKLQGGGKKSKLRDTSKGATFDPNYLSSLRKKRAAKTESKAPQHPVRPYKEDRPSSDPDQRKKDLKDHLVKMALVKAKKVKESQDEATEKGKREVARFKKASAMGKQYATRAGSHLGLDTEKDSRLGKRLKKVELSNLADIAKGGHPNSSYTVARAAHKKDMARQGSAAVKNIAQMSKAKGKPDLGDHDWRDLRTNIVRKPKKECTEAEPITMIQDEATEKGKREVIKLKKATAAGREMAHKMGKGLAQFRELMPKKDADDAFKRLAKKAAPDNMATIRQKANESKGVAMNKELMRLTEKINPRAFTLND